MAAEVDLPGFKHMPSKPLISLRNVCKTYVTGDVALEVLIDITFAIEAGEFVAIMGPSGSGKSTLMHIIGALDLATSGLYTLDGLDITQVTDDDLARIRNKKIGFVFQAFNLLPRTSALHNVMVPLEYAEVSGDIQEQKSREMLELVGLGNRAHHMPNQLSGGQQQRVAIARALVMNPAILLADEPTGNIASTQAAEIMEIFVRLHQKGHTIVMITHEPDIAAYAQRIIHIRDGRIISMEKNQRNPK